MDFETKYNTKVPAVKRLMLEACELKEPTEEYSAFPLDDNLFEWHFTVKGADGTDFENGVYHGRILLPNEYPMKPPNIILLTPNGRFETNKKICLSISGHHPETWMPSWSIRTALLALIAFLPTPGKGTIGALDYTPEERRLLAKKSRTWKCPKCGLVRSLLGHSSSNSPVSPAESQLIQSVVFKMAKSPPEPLYTYRGCMTSVHCLLPLRRNGSELLYAGTSSGKVHVWNLLTHREVTVHKVGEDACLSIQYVPVKSELWFVTQEKGGSMKFWTEECSEWKLKKSLLNDYYGFCSMVILNNIIYVPDHESRIRKYFIQENKEVLFEGKKEHGQVMCLTSIRADCLMAAYETGDVFLLNDGLQPLASYKFSTDCPMALDCCHRTHEGIIGSNSDTFYKFKIDEEPLTIVKLKEGKLTNGGVGCVALNEEGTLCVMGCWDGRIRYFSMRSLKLLAVLTHHTAPILSITFVRESGVLTAGASDSRISLWNLYASRPSPSQLF